MPWAIWHFSRVFQPIKEKKMNTGIEKSLTMSSPSMDRLHASIKKFKKSRILLLMVLPTVVYFVLFHYLPMKGVLIAFKDYSVFKGFPASPWVGLKYFNIFFSNPEALRLIKNTLLLSLYSLLWGFPVPILFALVLNEVRNLKMKKLVQTVSYMPHFISTVVVAGIIMMFLSPTSGVINNLISSLGFERINFMGKASCFRSIYVVSGIWQHAGWDSILYIAAITGIDPQLYESAIMDGASKLKQIIHITLPCIAPTMITIFILNFGSIMNVGFEKVFLLQNPVIYDTADVISTFVYRQGIKSGNYSYGTAVDLFNSVVNLIILVSVNAIAKRTNETSLW